MAVAADGAGTSERAPEGARLACEAVVRQAETWASRTPDLAAFAREDCLPWLGKARKRIARAARAESIDPFATSPAPSSSPSWARRGPSSSRSATV